jgi:hypothetical protein|eukprot:COSAG06_NODE_35705_length_456_cov_1.420168_1_plen_48_part_00
MGLDVPTVLSGAALAVSLYTCLKIDCAAGTPKRGADTPTEVELTAYI